VDGEEGQDGEDSEGGWSLEGLVETFTSQSESVMGGYHHLEDLGSRLRLKTAALQAIAAHVAPVLPSALEASVSAASDKLKSIGQAFNDHNIVAGLLSNLQDHGLRQSSYNSSICTWPWRGIWVNT
jgi:geranylgeranyl pyrophosphate synthase